MPIPALVHGAPAGLGRHSPGANLLVGEDFRNKRPPYGRAKASRADKRAVAPARDRLGLGPGPAGRSTVKSADTEGGQGPLGALAAARPASPAAQVLLDWLDAHIALQSRLDHDGVTGWTHRSVYELVAARGRWFAPCILPAQIRPLPERQCFANAMATEREHPHLAYTEGFAVAADSPVPTAHAWCTDTDGYAIDPTWSDLGGSAYLGIVLPPHLRPRAPDNWGVLEAPDSLYPLLSEGM